MKRSLTVLILLLSLLLTLAFPVFAADPTELPAIEQIVALDKAQKAFNIPEGYKLIETRLGDSWGPMGPSSNKVWQFRWSKQEYRKGAEISISVDAQTGVIKEINNWKWDETQQNLKTKYTREQAKAKAETFIKLQQPKVLGECRLEPPMPGEEDPNMDENYPKQYSFHYVRLVNGIPYANNGFNLNYDGASGELRSYSFNWEDTSFPQGNNTISATKALDIFKNIGGLELAYQKDYIEYGPSELRLIYRMKEMWGLNIDAQTGDWLDSEGSKFTFPDQTLLKGTSEPVKENPVLEKELTLNQALDIAKARVTIPADYKLTNSNYWDTQEPFRQQKIWSFQWTKNNNSEPEGLNVEVDTTTGEIRSFYKYSNYGRSQDDKVNPITSEEALSKAIAAIKQYQPGKLAQLRLEPNMDNARIKRAQNAAEAFPYSFSFTRMVNGLPYNNNNVWVEVNSVTGDIQSFRSEWEITEFPSVSNVINLVNAYQIFEDKVGFELVYNRAFISKFNGQPEMGDLKLVYRIKDVGFNGIDAKTGELMDLNYFRKLRSFNDVKGHWAQKEIENLSAKGLINGDNGKYKPEDPITRAEFAKLIVTAKRLKPIAPEKPKFTDVAKNAWYYGYVEAASKEGLMNGSGKNFSPDSPITRQEIVTILIRALGKAEEANAKAKEKTAYKDAADISPWAIGSVVVGTNLKLVMGNGGKFLPNNKATRAESAVFITRFISQQTPLENMSQERVVGK